MFFEFAIVAVGCITIASVVEKLLKHRREMEKIRVTKAAPVEGSATELRELLSQWKQTSSEFDLSLESNQQLIARRIESLEQRLNQLENRNVN